MASRKLQDNFSYPPRAMRAERAAAYLSMSTSTFLALVKENWPKDKPFPSKLLIGSGVNALGSGLELARSAGALIERLVIQAFRKKGHRARQQRRRDALAERQRPRPGGARRPTGQNRPYPETYRSLTRPPWAAARSPLLPPRLPRI